MGLVSRLKAGLRRARTRIAVAVALAVAGLGQTTTIDTTTFTSLINSLLPLLIAMISVAIPIIFFNKIMELIERLFKSFS